jgi:hypothetical protein
MNSTINNHTEPASNLIIETGKQTNFFLQNLKTTNNISYWFFGNEHNGLPGQWLGDGSMETGCPLLSCCCCQKPPFAATN